MFDAARLATLLSDGIGNSGTATRMGMSGPEALYDAVVQTRLNDMYLAAPTFYGLMDPMGTMGRKAAHVGGRNFAMDLEESVESVNNLLGIK